MGKNSLGARRNTRREKRLDGFSRRGWGGAWGPAWAAAGSSIGQNEAFTASRMGEPAAMWPQQFAVCR